MPETKPDDHTLILRFPAGLNNRDRETALPEGTLRVCRNLDVTRAGGFISRAGLRKVLDGDCHSLWAHPTGRFSLLVRDGTLVRLEKDDTATALVSVAGPVVYTSLNDDVYWTDGATVGQVRADGVVSVWGMSTPPEPVCAAVMSGGLFAGTYQVAMTAIHPSGLESGAPSTVSVEVAEGGGIQVVTPGAVGVRFALYCTGPGGAAAELRQFTVVDPGTTTLLGVGLLGKPLESLFATRPIPGQCITTHGGRLWGATGRLVWFTSEKSPHWVYPATGYYSFEQEVTVLTPVEDGLYVGLRHRIYFLSGLDPYKMTQRLVSSVGAIKNSGIDIPCDLFSGEGSPSSRQGAFYDTDGFLCVGKSGGFLARPTQKHFSAGETSSGFTAYREYEGLRQVVAVLDSITNPLMATDVLVTQVFQNGVVLNG